jgi:polar amino acid transport system permease protein
VAKTEVPETPGGTGSSVKAIPARHPGRTVATAVVAIVAIWLLQGILTSPRFQWSVFRKFFFQHVVLVGVERTLMLTVIAMVIGVAMGVILAVMRLSPARVVSGAAWFYIWFFRGTPLLVQILFWFNIASLTGAHPALGVPFTHVVLFHANANALITKQTAAILALGLNEAAYMAEIVRAGILSVDEGQTEAAQSIGMGRIQTMRLIVLPQAMRVIIPPTGNETISMLKTTSLISAIGYGELLYTVQLIYSVTYKTIPMLIVAVVWYLILTTILTVGQYYIERHYARGASRNLPLTPLQQLRAIFVRSQTSSHGQTLPPYAGPRMEHR